MTTATTSEPGGASAAERARRGAWRQRALYLSAMAVFAAALWWTGRGGTRTVEAFRRQIELVLKASDRSLQIEPLDATTLLVTGRDLFYIADITPFWDRYRSGSLESAYPAASEIQEALRVERDAVSRVLANPRRDKLVIGLPLPLTAVHPGFTESMAATKCQVIEWRGIPYFATYLDESRTDAAGRPSLHLLPRTSAADEYDVPATRPGAIGIPPRAVLAMQFVVLADALAFDARIESDHFADENRDERGPLGSRPPTGPAVELGAAVGVPMPPLFLLFSSDYCEALDRAAASRTLRIVAASPWDVIVAAEPIADAAIVAWANSGVASNDTRWDVAAVFALQGTTLKFERLVPLDEGAAQGTERR